MTDHPDVDAEAFQLSPVGLALTLERTILTCNARFEATFGYDPGTLAGQSLSLLYPSADEYRRIGEIGLAEMKRTGSYHDERIMKRRDGSKFWCSVHGQSRDRTSPYARAVWCMIDISDSRPIVDLSRRERQVAMLVTEGRTSKQIAETLQISPRTVEAHRARLFEKLKVRNTAECVARLSGLPMLGPEG
ncbi:PAS and helix-turn-helix domain-containing protein [Pseudooceanicola sp. HF7]|uniref:PAS and helix-turn-helix domain-containing protein n=1 Tax=Pseudooceanicola sp. HF7 TaxID=2721560 RepID=UPI001430F619|nr:PAS and helix-turn-helix domain-containing protein [Pseudooceanicola sp. HF7]NIZ10575.1 PAS and helix-turn-helix domain-containing protein [Pseudooceanicola sp. HF7]